MPFRDTPQERRFAEKTIPAILALGPDELVVGIDAPATAQFLDFIQKMCGDANLRIVEVQRSNEWGFHLAHVTWRMYEACQNDIILTTTIDYILDPSVRDGASLAKGVGAVTVLSKYLMRGIGVVAFAADVQKKPDQHMPHLRPAAVL